MQKKIKVTFFKFWDDYSNFFGFQIFRVNFVGDGLIWNLHCNS